MKDKYPKMHPVIVRWVDSMKTNGWTKYEASGMECTSVGHLVAKSKDRVVIAMNQSTCGDGDFMEIPMVAVKSVKKLKE